MKIYILALIILLSFTSQNYSQEKIEIQNIIKQNDITKFNNQNLILLDFWATWCAPCIPAGKQLEVYQSQLKDKVYMIAISYENEYKIKKFLEKHNIQIAVYQDFDSKNVRKFNVNYWPFTVVLDTGGKVLWKGSPGNLNVNTLNRLHNQTDKKSYTLNEIFDFKEKLKEEIVINQKDTLDLYLNLHSLRVEDNQFFKSKDRVNFNGDLETFISKLYSIPKVNVKSDFKQYIEFSSTLDIWLNNKDKILNNITQQIDMSLENKYIKTKAYEVYVKDHSKLWNKSQINWGENNPQNYLIGNDRVEADNLSLSEINELLTELKGVNYIYIGDNTNKYDWNFHYKYDNLMADELLYEFGIGILPLKTIEVETIIIKKGNSSVD